MGPEDVVQSACRSFFRRAGAGAFTVTEPGDLWRLLARITVRKACRGARRHGAGCRAVGREEVAGAERPDGGPTPAEAAAVADELAAALAELPPSWRRIAELRLEGLAPEAIAEREGCSARTVRRALDALRAELERRLLRPDEPCPPLPYGDVVLRQLLGSGGMGKVYRAECRRDGRVVAVKVLRKQLLGRPGVVERFRDEARALARLSHPGIVRVHGVGRLPDGGHFLVMDLIDGPDLGQVLAAGPVPVGPAVRWVAQAADALDFAHRQGVVHCDLKPANVLLSRMGNGEWGMGNEMTDAGGEPVPLSGDVKVVDFGLARWLGPGVARSVGGTAGYMAPEQWDEGLGGVTPRTDVFGLGGLLYALLTGRPPAPAGNGGEVARPSALRPGVPAAVEAVCLGCLEPLPNDRWASAGEVALELRGALAEGEAPRP
jgi:DNA-directed RNA polymerase specialized sigma24 family protein/tRNA A-37 threonylcarbamoyl transferase component Bud32